MFLSIIRIGLVALCASVALAVPTISIKGGNFVNSQTGDRFQIVGVAYQPGGSSGYDPSSGIDPLSNSAACLRDAALMQKLGVNAIRVYNVSPDLNHDLCMSIFNAVGIYVALDVNSPLPGESIDRTAPWTTYTNSYMNRTFAVVEAFKNFPNTLLFFSGNEVINDDPSGTIDPPYMRAVTRDLKAYIAKHSTRAIPVAYSAADVRDILFDTWNYLQCTQTPGTTDNSRIDLFALNSYSWCGDATTASSQWDMLASTFANSSVPVFFSEYGCNKVYPRLFTEVPALYGPQLSAGLSGGIVFEFTQGENNFGLVNVSSDGSAQLLQDYNTLQGKYSSLNFTLIEDTAPQAAANQPPTCSPSLFTSSTFNSNFTIPATPAQALIDHGIATSNVGQLVAVGTLQVSQVVTTTAGLVIGGLAIAPIADDESNVPSLANNTLPTAAAASSTSTGAASAATTTSSAPAASSSMASAATKGHGAGAGSSSAGLFVCMLVAIWFL